MNDGRMIEIRVYRIPMAKQGDRSAIRKNKYGRSYVHHYQKKKVVQEEQTLALIMQEYRPPEIWDGPIRMHARFIFPWPTGTSAKKRKSGCFWKATKPDLDNLEKLLNDAAEGVIYMNDSRIADKHVQKVYGDTPCIEIMYEKLD